MARSEIPSPEKKIWGTLEDLLLTCAVERHGTQNWDSVAVELQRRTAATAHLYTVELCRDRYRFLELRFGTGGGVAVSNPLIDELRKLRVAELRREVELRDASIGSLKVTLKRLQEERERSLSTAAAGEAPPGTKEGDSIADGSCKESNSTEPKESAANPAGEVEKPAEPPAEKAVSVAHGDKANGEISCNGSSGSFAKDDGAPAESKGDDGGEKEDSEVHSSSASRTRRRRTRQRKIVSGNSGVVAGESQPLVSILEIIRSNKYGHVFERRRKSQESEKYKQLIRHHVDLQTVRSKIARGKYTSAEFFRDLLLLCNNAVVFYPRNSHESISAVQLRKLVADQLPAVHPFHKPSIKSEPLAAWKKRSVSKISEKPEVKSEPSDLEESSSDEDNVVLAKKIASRGLRSSKNRSSKILKVLKPEKSTKIVGSNGGGAPTSSRKRGAASLLSRKGKMSETKGKGTVGEQKKTSKDGGGEGKRTAAASRSSIKNAGAPPKRGAAVTASLKVGKRGRGDAPTTRKRARK